MPIYEYICNLCGDEFTKLQKMGAKEGEAPCPKCGSAQVTRKISGCSIGTGGGKGGEGPSCGMGGG